MYQNNPRIDRRIKLSTLSRENLPNDRIQDCIQSECINETAIQITSVASDGNALISHGGYKQNKTKRNNQAISGCKVLGNLNMYTKNKTRLTSWKQITALVVLVLFMWQLSFASAHAQNFPSTLIGFAYEDLTGDGFGDAGIPNVALHLLDANGVPVTDSNDNVIIAVTDQDGRYSFNVQPGAYQVRQIQPAGYISLTPDLVEAEVEAGYQYWGLDFVEELDSNTPGLLVPPTKLIGFVYAESTGDDIGDMGIEGVVLELLTISGNVIDTTTTNVDGKYSFDVQPGTYQVYQIQPDNYISISPDIVEGTVQAGYEYWGLDFLEVVDSISTGLQDTDLQDAKLIGFVYEEKTGDLIGDIGIEGVTIELYSTNGMMLADTVTDANGQYVFSVQAGTYEVRQVQPDGYVSVTRDALESTVDAGYQYWGLDFLESADGITIANQVISTKLVGFVYEETTGDDKGDVGIAGVTLELLDADGTVLDSTVTDADGKYVFDVAPGSYYVRQIQPFGYASVSADIIAGSVEAGYEYWGLDFLETEADNQTLIVQSDAQVPLAISLSNLGISTQQYSVWLLISSLVGATMITILFSKAQTQE